jgi:hypothetical protein
VNTEQRRGKNRDVPIPRFTRRPVEQILIHPNEHRAQGDEKRNLRRMKGRRIQPVSQPEVDCERERNERTVRRVLRKAAECVRIGEKPRRVAQTANVKIVFDYVGIIEVKRVVQRVPVNAYDQRDRGYTRSKKPGLLPIVERPPTCHGSRNHMALLRPFPLL